MTMTLLPLHTTQERERELSASRRPPSTCARFCCCAGPKLAELSADTRRRTIPLALLWLTLGLFVEVAAVDWISQLSPAEHALLVEQPDLTGRLGFGVGPTSLIAGGHFTTADRSHGAHDLYTPVSTARCDVTPSHMRCNMRARKNK